MAQSTSKATATKKSAVPPKTLATAKKPATPTKAVSSKAAPKSTPTKAAGAKEPIKATTAKSPAKKATSRATPAPSKAKGNSEAAGAKTLVARTIGGVTPEQRYRMICDAAYFRAERRGFVGGNAVQDWLDAESEIDDLLRAMQE